VIHPLRMSEDPFLESAERIFARGKVAGSIRSHRWRSTPLGDIDSWPLPLVFTLNLVLNSSAPCFVFWGSQMLQFYNDGCLPLLGAKHPHFLGRPASDCWAEFWHIIGPQLRAVFERGETVTHDHARLPILRDGLREDTYWNYSLSPILDEQGDIGGILIICCDVTPELVATQQLDEAEDRLSRILDVLDESVIVTDRKGRVERINPAAASLTGVSPSEAIGQPLHLAMRISREHNALAIQNLLDQLQEREIVHHVAHRIHNRRERTILLAELSGSAMQNGDGEFDGAVIVLRRIPSERGVPTISPLR
jgi:PAS domain S-box-containing protein